ncbi:MAG: hypothetical protein KDA96_06305 [Planctomycetaceae bacterium]|nr:hypothetical protein [Planctomycetaceae bacterium]
MNETGTSNRVCCYGAIPYVVVVFAFLMLSAMLGVTVPTEVPDTSGYTEFEWGAPEFLAQKRTFGYPLFLLLQKALVGDHRWASWGHALIYAAAAVFFSATVSKLPRTRLATLVGLLGSNIFWLYGQTIATDTPAAAMGLFTMAWTLRLSRCWTTRSAVAVCLSASAAWCIRPAMLAVIPAAAFTCFLTVSGSALTGSAVDSASPRLRERLLHSGRLLVLLCVPVLMFCGLRLVALGKFGIVSFGGYNLIGLVGQFPEADTVDLSTPEALAVQQAAARRKTESPPSLGELSEMNYTRLEANYDTAIWQWYEPAAREVVGDDATRVNSILREMGGEILRRSLRNYAVWLAKSFRQAVRRTLDDLAESPMGLVSIVLLAGSVLVRRQWPSREVIPLITTGLVYWGSLIGLTVLVCPPLSRMTDAAAVFAPAALLASAVDVLFPQEKFSKTQAKPDEQGLFAVRPPYTSVQSG